MNHKDKLDKAVEQSLATINHRQNFALTAANLVSHYFKDQGLVAPTVTWEGLEANSSKRRYGLSARLELGTPGVLDGTSYRVEMEVKFSGPVARIIVDGKEVWGAGAVIDQLTHGGAGDVGRAIIDVWIAQIEATI